MRKIKIASVFLLVIRKVRCFVMIDSVNNVVKIHIDYDGNDTELEFQKEEIKRFVSSQMPQMDLFQPEVSYVAKPEIFTYLQKTYCNEKK